MASYLREKHTIPCLASLGLWEVVVEFERDHARHWPYPVSTHDWAQRNQMDFGVRLGDPLPLPFIFRRLPRACRSLARRQRLLAVLLSLHPRVGMLSPLRVLDPALLHFILHVACPYP